MVGYGGKRSEIISHRNERARTTQRSEGATGECLVTTLQLLKDLVAEDLEVRRLCHVGIVNLNAKSGKLKVGDSTSSGRQGHKLQDIVHR